MGFTVILMECAQCKRRNYATTKPEKRKTEKLVLKKYCPWCRGHQEHREQKK